MVNTKKSGFTLIELLMAMILVSLIAVACIWVFQQSLDIRNMSVGRADVNKSFRITQNKLRKDLLDCLPLTSEIQNFIMISRYEDNDDFGRAFPKDFLSFAAITRVTEDVVMGFVSYDLVGDVLYRYTSDEYDWLNGRTGNTFNREVVARNCVSFRVEYLWRDERPEEIDGSGNPVFPSASPEFKILPDPGVFLSIHPYVNENSNGNNYATTYMTGGLNGTALVEHVSLDGTAYVHANGNGGANTRVLQEFQNSFVFGSGVATHGTSGGIMVPDHADWTTSYLEPSFGPAQGFDESGMATTSFVDSTLDTTPYQRIIHIRSPNLYPFHSDFRMADHEDSTYDITGCYPVGDVFTDGTVSNDEVIWARYKGFNPDPMGKGTFTPSQLRITMKIHSDGKTVLSTHSFVCHVPHAGR